MLAEAFWDVIVNTPHSYKRARVMAPSNDGDPFYVFLVISPFSSIPFAKSYEEYREVRRNFLHAYCLAVKLKYPHAIHVVGIATELGAFSPSRSEDLLYLDTREWTGEDFTEAQKLRDELGLLTNPQMFLEVESEYPEFVSRNKAVYRKSVKTGRNDPCPCGSGKKFKRCCGSPENKNRVTGSPDR